ncbi:thioredoxin family protein [Flavobacterium sp. SM2513]|uniref:thioredoxin family protein n=1 Tax=Flavobacterium sp. SM2513 TaxID=3424766 RepID=UPI003D7F907D
MKDIISNSLANSYSYENYRTRLKSLLAEGKSSGDDQSEDLLHYSELNETRMNRLDKTIRITPETEQFLSSLKTEYIWLVLSEGWCGDAAQLLPIMNKMAQISDKIDLQIAFRDENPELMTLFLTNGGKAIPKLIIVNKDTLEVVADWGPRPAEAVKLIVDYKAKFGIVDETVKTELQMWYLHDKGISTQNEIVVLLSE